MINPVGIKTNKREGALAFSRSYRSTLKLHEKDLVGSHPTSSTLSALSMVKMSAVCLLFKKIRKIMIFF